jgi:class 3 adenylate cyclase
VDRPDTRYTTSDGFSIAYQVFGDGPVDLVYLPQFFSNVEWNWEMPEHASFMRRLASFARVIVMDHRGVGCSDRLSPGEEAPLESLVDDVLAVIGAATSFQATLFCGGHSGFVGLLAAATHPDRIDGLILFEASPSWRRSDELPWQASEAEWRNDIDSYRRSSSMLEWADAWTRRFAPTLRDRDGAVRALASYSALTRAMGAGITQDLMLSRVDLRDLLPTIGVPTLVLHRAEDPLEPIQSGRFLAERIPGARFVELPGFDYLPWVGDAGDVLDEIEMFVTGERRVQVPDRVLGTVLFTDIVDSTARAASMGDVAWRDVRAEHDRVVRAELGRSGGREIKTMGDGFLAMFDGPAKGVRCAEAIATGVQALGIEIRAGLHAGEVELEGEDVSGIAVAIGARVGALAGPSEVLVSQTVKDLVVGSGLTFEDAGEHELKGVPDRWRLYRVAG